MILEIIEEAELRVDPAAYSEKFYGFHICIFGCSTFCIGDCCCSSSSTAEA